MEKTKIEINRHMLLLIFIICITALNDIMVYFFSINYELSLLISIALISILYFFNKKKIQITIDFSKLDLIPFFLYLIISFFLIIYLDDFIDTITYHIYNQRNPFIDKINFDFLPSSTTFFPLGDRMYYIFTKYLGYRVGVILSGYILIILYYQTKKALTIVLPKLSEKRIILWSSIVIFSLTANSLIFKYNVDSFSMVILFELIYIFIKNVNVFENKNYLYFSVLLSGIAIGIKISNSVLVTVILFAIIINSLVKIKYKFCKFIKPYDFLFLLIIFVFPYIVYMINNYHQTGNPVFPFFNGIFKSIYYKEIAGADLRLGYKNIIEFFLWPIIICFNPVLGDDIIERIDLIWGLGYIVSILYLFIGKNKTIRKLSLLNLILTIVWIKFISGYARYGLAISFTYYFIVIYVIETIIDGLKGETKKEKLINIYKFASVASMLIIIAVTVIDGIDMLLYRMAHSLYYSMGIEEKSGSISGKYDIDGVWICTKYNTSYIDLIRYKEDPMYNIDIVLKKDPMWEVENDFSDYSKKEFYEKLKNKKLYTIISTKYYNYIVELLNKNGFEMKEKILYMDKKILNKYNYLYIVEISYIGVT